MSQNKEWKNVFGYWNHQTEKQINSKLNVEGIPSDWVLSVGSFWARLSWKGIANDGHWVFTSPFISKCIMNEGIPVDIDWLPTNTSELSEARDRVEQKLAQALTIMRDELDHSLSALITRSCTRIVNGKEMKVSSTSSG